MLTAAELTGRADSHIITLDDPPCRLHRDVVQPFLAMRDAAAQDGIDLMPVSSYRDFAAQARIWNRKYRGLHPLYDADGQPRDHASLDKDALLEAILCWSAVPGGSRHHWGTDIDVVDRAVLPEGYRIDLLPAEFEDGALFGKLRRWLDANMSQFGFFRPYDRYRGGLYAEPWHLSYAPVSVPALEALTVDVLRDALAAEEVDGKTRVMERLPEIHARYIAAVGAP